MHKPFFKNTRYYLSVMAGIFNKLLPGIQTGLYHPCQKHIGKISFKCFQVHHWSPVDVIAKFDSQFVQEFIIG